MPDYKFLTEADVLSRIRDEHREAITDLDTSDDADQDATEASLGVELSCESMAIAKVRSALWGRFDVDTMLAKEDDERDPLLVLHVLNVFTYYLYRRINPRKIPEVVKEDHNETLSWLDRLAEGKETPDFPAVEADEENTGLARFGGGQQIGGHYF